jgi:SOS-response transcriptional repressor LexA
MEKGDNEPRSITKIRVIRALGFSDENAFLGHVFKTLNGVTPTVTVNSDGSRTLEATWTSNGEGRIDDLRTPEAKLLPIYNWGACGDPRNTHSAPDPSDLDYPPIGKERLVGQNGFGIRARGKSMTNRRIDDGDIVWVNPDQSPRIGRVVAARTWNLDGDECGTVIKVWRKNEQGGDQLWGDGEDEDGRDYIACSRFDLLGPVVWISPQGFPPD